MGVNIISGSGKRANAAVDIGVKTLNNKAEESPISGGTGTANKSFITITAAENIAKYDVVTTEGFIANSATDAHKSKILGIAIEDIGTGSSGSIQTFGDIDNALWSWSAKTTLFLNGTGVSNVAPSTGFVATLGVIRNPTKIFINIKLSVKL